MSENPYQPPQAPSSDEPSAPSVPPPAPKRIWPVFVLFLLVLVGTIAAQIPAAVVVVMLYFSQGGTPDQAGEKVPQLLTAPWALMALLLSSQLVVGAGALLPAWLSPTPLRERLALRPAPWPVWMHAVAAIGGWIPAGLGMAAAHALALILEPDPTARLLYRQMTPEAAIPFILLIALAPGFCEELLFRGYMQQRLQQRWPAWLAILTASLLFAIMHIMPHTVIFAFPVGLYLGLLAWRTGSIWPCIACHAFINGSWNIYQIGTHLGYFPDPPPLAILIGGAVLIVGCFGTTLWWLVKTNAAGRR